MSKSVTAANLVLCGLSEYAVTQGISMSAAAVELNVYIDRPAKVNVACYPTRHQHIIICFDFNIKKSKLS